MLCIALGKERNATAKQHRVDPGPVLVDQTQGGHLGGESRAADRDVPLPGLGSQSLDFLRQATGCQPGVSLDLRQGRGEHHLRERLPDRSEFERRVVERRVLVGGLPVQHGLVQPSSQQMNADLAYLVGGEAKDLLVWFRPVGGAIRPGDVAVQRHGHRVGHAAHQKSSSVTGSTVRPPDPAGLIAARGIPSDLPAPREDHREGRRSRRRTRPGARPPRVAPAWSRGPGARTARCGRVRPRTATCPPRRRRPGRC